MKGPLTHVSWRRVVVVVGACHPVEQEDVSSCPARRTGLLVQQVDASSCATRGRVFLLNKEARLLVRHGDISWTTAQVLLFNDQTCPLFTRGHVCLNKGTHLPVEQKTCLLAGQEGKSSCSSNMSSCPTGRRVFASLQGDTSSCSRRGHVLLLTSRTC